MFSVKLSEIIKTLKLETLYCTDEMLETEIDCADVNRPSLQLTGFFDYFNPKRIQIIGKVEMTYLDQLDAEERKKRTEALFSKGVPAAIVTRGLEPYPEMHELATKYGVPLLRTNDSTSRFMGELIKNLNVWLAPRITRHGVLVEVYGEGLLLLGESGVGKSEAAIELLKRGHRLVADDAVEIKKVSDSTLVGTSPEIIRHFIELRGIGIVNVRNIFGIGAVKETENINLVVNLEPWQQGVEYERLGLDNGHTEILDIQVPSITIPVKQGRNLAVILEVAAMNNRQKRMGFNAAQELNQRLMEQGGLS